MDSFRPFVSGESLAPRLNATWLNAVNAAAKPNKGALGAADAPGARARDYLDMVAKNDTGGDLDDEFPIVRLDVPVFTVSDDAKAPWKRPTFKVKKPDATTAADFCVMQGRCPSNKLRPVITRGLSWCKVNVTDAGHKYATSINADSAKLESGNDGCRIRWKESGTGVKWAVVDVGGRGALEGGSEFGVLVADVPATSVTYRSAAPWTEIDPGEAAAAVMPMQRVATADKYTAKLNEAGDAQVLLRAVNPFWPTEIKAGTTTNADKPVVVCGYQTKWPVAGVQTDVFVITNVAYPVTIMKGLCQGAVSGGSFTADNLTLWWGRDPGVSSISGVANPASLDGADDAVCVIMQIPDGTWVCLGIECA